MFAAFSYFLAIPASFPIHLDLFYRIVGAAHDTGAEKQPLDIIATVKLDGQFYQFADRECGSRMIVAATVDAVSTVVHAMVREHDFEERHTTSVVREAMADAHPADGIA